MSAKGGLTVLIETWIGPRPSTRTKPSSPNVTSATTSSSGSDVRTGSQSARSPSPAAAVAPLATRGGMSFIAIIDFNLKTISHQIAGKIAAHRTQANDADPLN